MATITYTPDNVTLMSARMGAVPQEFSDQILTGVKTGSAFMRLAKAITIAKPETQFTHMSGVGAYWVDEGARIQTSKPTWLKLTMRAKKLGVTIPCTKEHLKYSVSDFFELMKAEVAQAFYRKVDAAAFAGIDNPYAFSVLQSATAAGHVLTKTGDAYADVNEAMGLVEDEDFTPNGLAALASQQREFRGARDAAGAPIASVAAGAPDEVLGLPVAYLANDAFDKGPIIQIVGDWNEALYGILGGIDYQILTEATLPSIEASDAPGEPFSLAERDSIALKATMEVGMMITSDKAFTVIQR